MRRYAFIDVPNTAGTAFNVLGFSIDWERLYELLVNSKWSCTAAFFYKGHKGEKEKDQLERMAAIGYQVRTKLTHIHPDWQKQVRIECPYCHREFLFEQIIKGGQKSNCDVELTVDALATLKAGDEAMIFTGDGDFAYLIEALLERGVSVKLISSKKSDHVGRKRFSTRLSTILAREELGERRVQFIHLNNWRRLIERAGV